MQPLAALGHDDLSVIMSLAESGLTGMCTSDSMLLGHVAALEVKPCGVACAVRVAAAAPPACGAGVPPTTTSTSDEMAAVAGLP